MQFTDICSQLKDIATVFRLINVCEKFILVSTAFWQSNQNTTSVKCDKDSD